jgi:hypothetical protein
MGWPSVIFLSIQHVEWACPFTRIAEVYLEIRRFNALIPPEVERD